MQQKKRYDIRRITTLILAVCGALGSLSFTLYNGRNNKSFVLGGMFVVWVLSPFTAIIFASLKAKNQPGGSVAALITTLIVTTGCLLAYSGLLTPPGAKLTAIFLIAPLVAWVVIGAGKLAGRRNG